MSEKAIFDGVTPNQMSFVTEHFKSHGLVKGDTTSGVATVHGVPMDYSYDNASQLLTVAIREPSERMSVAKIQDLVGRLRQAHDKTAYDELGPGYNHVDVTMENNSGKTLIFAGADVEDGVIDIKVQDLPTGQTEYIFQAKSSTASVIGCRGDVTYQIDPQTMVTMSYHLHGKAIHSFTVAVNGQNAKMYRVSARDTEAGYDCAGAYTYMRPTVVVNKA
ncbi:hypothetical protein DV096_15520 [Bradymonadaceae bacterium TMQ3]|nr:hypothetical protein DV096_15520 [Bradymonadaceae bacterium TMQ3]TXC73044.1 hypothetical protein FRC91_16460 [Bradymonadales bacterium TMQ1]